MAACAPQRHDPEKHWSIRLGGERVRSAWRVHRRVLGPDHRTGRGGSGQPTLRLEGLGVPEITGLGIQRKKETSLILLAYSALRQMGSRSCHDAITFSLTRCEMEESAKRQIRQNVHIVMRQECCPFLKAEDCVNMVCGRVPAPRIAHAHSTRKLKFQLPSRGLDGWPVRKRASFCTPHCVAMIFSDR